jgi:hypothetical protein
MTQEINRTEWKNFADFISRRFLDWEVVVRVLNNDSGAQVLSDGLPFNGLTFDRHNGDASFEISIGTDAAYHQTHNIDAPVKIAFEERGAGPSGTLDIEDAAGTKTLITFIQPVQVLAAPGSHEVIAFN